MGIAWTQLWDNSCNWFLSQQKAYKRSFIAKPTLSSVLLKTNCAMWLDLLASFLFVCIHLGALTPPGARPDQFYCNHRQTQSQRNLLVSTFLGQPDLWFLASILCGSQSQCSIRKLCMTKETKNESIKEHSNSCLTECYQPFPSKSSLSISGISWFSKLIWSGKLFKKRFCLKTESSLLPEKKKSISLCDWS